MMDEIRAVLLFEYRRYMRARRYWVRLLRNAGIGALIAVVLHAVDTIYQSAFDTAFLALPALFAVGFLIASQVLSLAEALFDDAYEGRALPDLWLVGMSPLSLVLGRWVFAGFYALFTVIALAPAIWLSARVVGVSFALVATALAVSWLSVMRDVPELFLYKIYRRRAELQGWQLESGTGESSATVVLGILLVMFYFVLAIVAAGAPPAMPIFLFAPPLALMEAHRYVVLGGWELPVSVLGVVFLGGFAALGLMSVLRAMDVPMFWARFWQPLVGSTLLLGLWGVSLAAYASQMVQTPAQAQGVAMNSLWLGWLLYSLFQFELAHFALWRGEIVRSAALPSLRGVLWLAGVWMGMGVAAPLIVYAVSGQAVEPLRWGLVLTVLGAQCLSVGRMLYSLRPLENNGTTRYAFAVSSFTASAVFVWLVALGTWLLWTFARMVRVPVLQAIIETVCYLSPTLWVLLPDAPLWVYGAYAVYNLALALVWGFVRARLQVRWSRA
ncbi:MAG: hypothetical protein RMK45_05850 [Armatimonadota bacterium]|nr:hypothetical protein [Armatimonadota bacterium]